MIRRVYVKETGKFSQGRGFRVESRVSFVSLAKKMFREYAGIG